MRSMKYSGNFLHRLCSKNPQFHIHKEDKIENKGTKIEKNQFSARNKRISQSSLIEQRFIGFAVKRTMSLSIYYDSPITRMLSRNHPSMQPYARPPSGERGSQESQRE